MTGSRAGLVLAVWAGLLTIGLAQRSASTPKPDALLETALRSSRGVPLEMIQVRRPLQEDSPTVIRVQIDSRRRLRADVIRPLVSEGVISLDDGKVMQTYYPDRDMVVRRVSPLSQVQEPRERLNLVQRNYELDVVAGPSIAGQQTWQLSLQPKSPRLAPQFFFIDRKQNTILRIQTTNEEGEVILLLDTLFVRYRNTKMAYSLPPSQMGYRIWGPRPLTSLTDPEESLGFVPQVPKSFPFGFTLQRNEIMGAPPRHYSVITLTDGVLSATVFQWSKAIHGTKNPTSVDPIFSRNGVFFGIYGETPPSVARTLLSTFVTEKRSAASFRQPPSLLRDLVAPDFGGSPSSLEAVLASSSVPLSAW